MDSSHRSRTRSAFPFAFVCHVVGCQKSFQRKGRLDIHARIHTGERPYKCHFDGCDSSYARSQHLSRHIERVHTEGAKDCLKVRCPECRLELADKSGLQRHMRDLHQAPTCSRSYKCPEDNCGESFRKKRQLVLHRLQHADHLSVALKCYRCPQEGCTKTFTFPNKLRRHLKVHQGYHCDINGCDQILSSWSALRKHKAVDHAPTHTCSLCGMNFKQKSNLRQHLQVHTERKKSFICPRANCERAFLYNKNLMQHIKEFHDGEIIWKDRRRQRKQAASKNQTHIKRKTMASRLCGVAENPGSKRALHPVNVETQGDTETSDIVNVVIGGNSASEDREFQAWAGKEHSHEFSSEELSNQHGDIPFSVSDCVPKNVDHPVACEKSKLGDVHFSFLAETQIR